jgi:hypothetical protein
VDAVLMKMFSVVVLFASGAVFGQTSESAAAVDAGTEAPLALALPPAPAPTEPSAQLIPPVPNRLSIGTQGFVEVHCLIQAWFLGSTDDNEPYAKLGAARNGFRVRRAELRISGEVLPTVAFTIMIDPAKVFEFGSKNFAVANQMPAGTEAVNGVLQPTSKVSIFQDAVLTFKFIPYVNISAGQARTPITAEGPSPAPRLVFIERSEIGRLFGDQRDIGAWAHYKFKRFGYQVGLYNGNPGGNTLEIDSNKDLVARLEVFPIDTLVVGGSVDRTLATTNKGVLTIAGADAKYVGHGLTLAGEFYWKQTHDRTAAAVETASMGGYGVAAFQFNVMKGALQPAIRFDWFDPNTTVVSDDYWRFTAGLNILLGGPETKLQINYTHTQAMVVGAITPTSANNELILVNAQTAF